MKFRFSIGRKIGTGFGVLILFTILVFFFTNDTLNKSKQINDLIYDTYNPSVYQLEELFYLINESERLTSEWVNVQSSDDAPNKKALIKIQEKSIPIQRNVIHRLSKRWIDDERAMAEKLFGKIDTNLLQKYTEIKEILSSFESYNDPNNRFFANILMDEVKMNVDEINLELNALIDLQKENAKKVSKQMIVSFDRLQFLVKYLGIALVIGGIFIAVYTTNTIVKPVQKLKMILLDLSKGIFPKRTIKAGRDEIGEMTEAMNKLVTGLNDTKAFANAIGSGNFDFPYEPLSDQDDLGKDLLKMRTDLAVNERILEDKVKQRTTEVVKQKEEIEHQSHEINRLYSEVTDSIIYARHIQQAILLPVSAIKKLLPVSFLFYKPKDIVSGDFYWMAQKGKRMYFAAVDCTGHGVPGAFMSIVGHNGLEQALMNNDGPAEILNALNRGVSTTFHENEHKQKTKDGMDIALCSLDYETRTLTYAGAFNPLFIARKGEVLITKADKFPIGSFLDGAVKEFTEHEIQLEENDMVYVFSDGYQDQFGGSKGKKFMVRRFRELLAKISSKDPDDQHDILEKNFAEWKGKEEQVDDILIIGVRV
jgi:serine phosphatase RsbU (regulator of sigma subunit)/soluble cytochrome b562